MPTLLRRDVRCTKCQLYKSCKSIRIDGDGPDNPDVLFVGEAPGAEEDAKGTPFIGESGRLLRDYLRQVSFSYRITNVVRCRPPNNRRPLPKEVASCSGYLQQEIRETKPKVIVALGDVACRTLTGSGGVVRRAGSLDALDPSFTLPARPKGLPPFKRPRVMVSLHPAYILRNPNLLPQWTAALDIIPSAIREGTEKKNYLLCNEDSSYEFREDEIVSLDYETTGLDPFSEKTICVAISSFGIGTHCLSNPESNPWWEEFLKSPCKKIVHNAGFDDYWSIVKFGTPINNLVWDTMIGERIRDSESTAGLERLALLHSDVPPYKMDFDWKTATPEKLYKYNCSDADATLQVYHAQKADETISPELMDWSLKYSRVANVMRANGMLIDKGLLQELTVKNAADLQKLEDEVRALQVVKSYERSSSKPYNIRSGKDNSAIIFERLCLAPKQKTGNGNPSINMRFLEWNSKEHPFIDLLRQYRAAEQIKKNFLDVIPEYIGDDGKVHPQWNVTGTSTWRFSCANPNIQNQPEETKGVFVPSQGYLWENDYSQIELRIIACLAGVRSLIEAFQRGEDVHKATAGIVYKVPLHQITKELRHKGKTANFSIVFGTSARGLEDKQNMEIGEAHELLGRMQRAMPELDTWKAEVIERARSLGYAEAPSGRRRHLPHLQSDDDKLRTHAERQAVNHLVQNSAAEITLRAMVKMQESGFRMIAQRYDSIIFESDNEMAGQVAKEIMQSVKPDWLTVPLDVEVSSGPTWGNMEVVK